MVVGAANNQLLEERHGELLHQRGILYVPDYAANAGGIINGCIELLGWDAARTAAKVEEIYDTVANLLALSAREGVLPHRAADLMVERRLSGAATA
jgi:leucine dehydrogenase